MWGSLLRGGRGNWVGGIGGGGVVVTYSSCGNYLSDERIGRTVTSKLGR